MMGAWEDELLAYAFAELSGASRARFEALVAADPVLAREVDRLAAAAAALGAAVPPVSSAFNRRLRRRAEAQWSTMAGGAAGSSPEERPEEALVGEGLGAEEVRVSADFNARLKDRLRAEWAASASSHSDGSEGHARRRPVPAPGPRWPWRASVAMAAAVLGVAALLWTSFYSIPTTHAYSLADLPMVLRRIRCLCVRGWVRQPLQTAGGQEFVTRPVAWYLERPNRFHCTLVPSGTNGYVVSDGRQWQQVDHDRRQVIGGREIDIHARLQVEALMQMGLIVDLLGRLSEYVKLGSEQLGTVQTDVYERLDADDGGERARTRIWLDPGTGLPVRVRSFAIVAGQPESMVAEYNEIRADGEAPPDAFEFLVPPGYAVGEQNREASAVGMAWVSARDRGGRIRLALNYEDRAILLCWAATGGSAAAPAADAAPDEALHIAPRESGGTWECDQHLIRVEAGAEQWHWTLVVPRDQSVRIGTEVFLVSFPGAEKDLFFRLTPLRFRGAELLDILTATMALDLGPHIAPAAAVQMLDRVEQLTATGRLN